MSFSKNIHSYRRYVRSIPLRQNSTIPNALQTTHKMQAKDLVLSQWKMLNQLKKYITTKFSIPEKTFDNVLNKEFAHFLQRIQPSVYGSELIRYIESLTVPQPRENIIKDKEGLAGVFNGFKVRNKNEEREIIPKWRTATYISQEAINCRTEQILTLLSQSTSDVKKLGRIEELIEHIKQYPKAKYTSVKKGAIRLLLRIREQSKNNIEIQGALNECLTLLGYINPVPNEGIRILSIDGGGTRGILVIEMLKKLEEFSGKPVHEMFDLICGVSTGAIIASLIGVKQYSLNEILEIYRNLSTQIFTQSPLKGTSNLVFSHAYYDTALWEKVLKDQIGGQSLINCNRNLKCPKLIAVSAVVNQSRLSAYVFRNYSLPCKVQSQYMGSHNHLIWEAVRASAAAPTYFEEFKLGNMLHQDGGILFNNPTAVALHEAKLLWPETPIQCVISFGTGRSTPIPVEDLNSSQKIARNSSWKNKFNFLIESATDTEGVHTMLSDLLPTNRYYRFNPYLTEMVNISEIDPKKMRQLELDVVMYLRRNEDKFKEAAKVLTVPKGVKRAVIDWLNLQRDMNGVDLKLKL